MHELFNSLPVSKEKMAYDLAIRFANINGNTEEEVYELFKSSYLKFSNAISKSYID